MVATNQRSLAILTALLAALLSEPVICRFLECGETYADTNGNISKPWQPSTNNTNRLSSCRLTIDTRNQSITAPHHLQLHVKAFDVTGIMPSCSHGNYLEILIGCQFISVGRFCGVSAFPMFYSTDGCLALVLHGEIRQLQAEYILRPLDREVQHIPSGCGISRLANTRQGNIFSPRWPLPYPDNVDCVWTVRARKNLQIKLIFFDFDVNIYKPCERLDFLEVRAGSSGYTNARTLQTKNTECGKKEPFDMIIKSDTFYITFRSERSTGPRGFMAGFVAYEKEKLEFEPHVLIAFGAVLLLVLIIVSLKKFAIPLLSFVRKRRRIKCTRKGCKKCWFPKGSRDSGYSCGCRRKKRRLLKHIKDCPHRETSEATPVIPKECLLDPSDGWDLPSESTFVPLPAPTPTIVKSASDNRLSPHAYPLEEDFNERRSSCKSVRFVESRQFKSAPFGPVLDS